MSADRDEGAAKVSVPTKLPADLGAFLFAEVGVEPGGMPLTVLSALARLGLDPWDKAGRLAKQPDQKAASQLAGHRWPDQLGATRRAVLGRMAMLAGMAAGAITWALPARALPNPRRLDPAAPRFLSPGELSFVTAAVDRLLPADEHGPGGVAAEVPRYIDMQLAGPWGRGDARYVAGPVKAGPPTLGDQSIQPPAEFYRASIAALRLLPDGRDFERLPLARQDALLTSLQQGEHDAGPLQGTRFFATLLTNAVEGFMADPRYGGNAGFIGWKLIGYPGVRYDWTPYLQNGGRPPGLPVIGTFGPADGYGVKS